LLQTLGNSMTRRVRDMVTIAVEVSICDLDQKEERRSTSRHWRTWSNRSASNPPSLSTSLLKW